MNFFNRVVDKRFNVPFKVEDPSGLYEGAVVEFKKNDGRYCLLRILSLDSATRVFPYLQPVCLLRAVVGTSRRR